jgi:hypothetical protein
MTSTEHAINLESGRLIKKSTAKYKKLKKLGKVKEIQDEKAIEPESEPEFDERDLQHRVADLTTSMVADNMKKIVKAQKLSDTEYDALLKRMLYKKLCIDEPKKPKKVKKTKKGKKKFKIVEPPSESESSDSE